MKTRFLFAAALAVAALPAFAQDGATLRVDSGSAMVSNGGEFTAAASGTQVSPGTRVMLTENSRATLVYPNGCTQPLSAAGTYGVPASCVAAGGSSSTGSATGLSAGATVGIVGGAVALIGVGLDNMDEQPAPPVSR